MNNKILLFIISFFGFVPGIFQTIGGNKNSTQFINNDRNFSTFQLCMTMIATTISLGGVSVVLNTAYRSGLNYFVPYVLGANIFHLIMILLMPRLTVFFYTSSFGKALEEIAGYQTMVIAIIISCIVSLLLCVGQFKLGIESAYFLTDDQKFVFLWAIGMSIALYVARGGIRAVVQSDVFQLLIGIIAIIVSGLFAIFLIKSNGIGDFSQILMLVSADIHNFKFDLKSAETLVLMVIPAFSATYTSRLFLAKDKKQAQTSFKWLGISWLFLSITLYILAKILMVLTNSTIEHVDIKNILMIFSGLDHSVVLFILMAWFMFAITTIDSLIQFVAIETANLLKIKEEKKLNIWFVVCPFLSMFLVCVIAWFDSAWQLDYMFIYRLMCQFLLVSISPIIFFYVIFQRKFTNSIASFGALVIGFSVVALLTKCNIDEIYKYLIGGSVNLLVLAVVRNSAKIEDRKHD